MDQALPDTDSNAEEVLSLRRELSDSHARIESLEHQPEWFKRQLFGRKSEKRRVEELPEQPLLDGFETGPAKSGPGVETETLTYTRKKRRGDDCVNDSGLRFDASVPVQVIELPAAELEGADCDDYEVISEKITWRLAQRPSSYLILKYVRPVVKRKDSGTLSSPPAPAGLWDSSSADVSFIAGMLTEKFVYHQPLYRQHQRLGRDGIVLSRETMTQWCHRAIRLLEPIHQAQMKPQCTMGKYRRISRWEHEAVTEAAEARLERAPQMMQVRRQTAEHSFGTIKAWMGTTPFLTKTRPR